MKHVLLLTFLSLIGISFLSAQESEESSKEPKEVLASFRKGQISISPGVMIGNWGPYTGGSSVPLMASAEIGLTNQIGIGAFAGISSYRYTDGASEYGYDFQSFGIRADLHYLTIIEAITGEEAKVSPRADFYLTGLFGYEQPSFFTNDDRVDPNSHKDRFILHGAAGARYYLTNHLGIYGEVGFIIYGVVNLGLTLRIP